MLFRHLAAPSPARHTPRTELRTEDRSDKIQNNILAASVNNIKNLISNDSEARVGFIRMYYTLIYDFNSLLFILILCNYIYYIIL